LNAVKGRDTDVNSWKIGGSRCCYTERELGLHCASKPKLHPLQTYTPHRQIPQRSDQKRTTPAKPAVQPKAELTRRFDKTTQK
jgi:hypothetical protein